MKTLYHLNKEATNGGIPKQTVLYVFRPEVNITCQKCVFIKDTNKCAVFGPNETVSPETGSCGFYIHGETKEMPWIGFVTKDEAGYMENKTGFQCKRCEYFNVKEKSCKKVDKNSEGDTPGMIHPNACCNAWSADEKRSKMNNAQLAKAIE